MSNAVDDEMKEEGGAPDVPADVEARWQSRRKSAVLVLRVLCALPALMVLYYAFFPKVSYTHRLTLSAPAAARAVEVGDVRLEPRDRAFGLVAVGEGGKDRQDAPHIVVRNNIKSATLYHRLRELPRPARLVLTLGCPRRRDRLPCARRARRPGGSRGISCCPSTAGSSRWRRPRTT